MFPIWNFFSIFSNGSWVRAFIELTIISIGWKLGGTIGLATLIFAFGIGPAVSVGLYSISAISKK